MRALFSDRRETLLFASIIIHAIQKKYVTPWTGPLANSYIFLGWTMGSVNKLRKSFVGVESGQLTNSSRKFRSGQPQGLTKKLTNSSRKFRNGQAQGLTKKRAGAKLSTYYSYNFN